MRSVVYHFVANFLLFQKTRRQLLLILPVRGATASASDVCVMSGMPDIGT